jgi:hypothetical protein
VVVRKNGALIRDRTREREIVLEVGDYTIDLAEKKDGLKLSTDRFSITQDGKETVKVRFEKNEPARALSTENHRRLAEWVLKQESGLVQPEGVGEVLQAADLPPVPFRCFYLRFSLPNIQALSPQVASWLMSLSAQTRVEIWLNSADWDDEGFRKFVPLLKEIQNPKVLLEAPSRITDEGLRHLAEVSQLTGVKLNSLRVTDEGLRNLAKLRHLDEIVLWYVPVTDTTLEALLSSGAFHTIGLRGDYSAGACLTAVLRNADLDALSLHLPLSDIDMPRLSGLKKLCLLNIASPTVTNEGFRHLETLPRLSQLEIGGKCQVDVGVFEHLSKLKNLTCLDFWDNKFITDKSLQCVKTLTELKILRLHQCGVTAEGVARLRAELPKLRVEWDGDKKMP